MNKEEKPTTYTEAQKRAIQKYLKESVDEIKVRVPKGYKDKIKMIAQKQGESVNEFIKISIEERTERITGGRLDSRSATDSI